MVVYTAFTQNVSTYYKSTLCSKSTLFLFITTFFTVVFPLLIAYRSQGFWVKNLSYREHPLVRYKHEYFLYMETAEYSNPILCTTIRKKTQVLEDLDKCTSIKFYEDDWNGDGKLDKLTMDVSVADTQSLKIQSVYLVLAFNYVLQHQCMLEMEGLAVIQSSAPFPGSRVDVLGDLQFIQKTLLPCRGRHLTYNQSAFSNPHVNIQRLVRSHAIQNVSTRFGNELIQWTRGDDTHFNLKLEVMYPEITVEYRPGFWPVMKWAWMQYFAILVIFWSLLDWVKRYVFINQLLPIVPVRPWKKMINA